MRSGNATPFKKMGSYSEGAKNLLKAVPNKEAYDKLSDVNKKGFDKAAKDAGLPMEKKSPAKQKADTKKTYPKSYTKKDIEFLKQQREDIVRRSDFDEGSEQQKMFDRNQAKPTPKYPNAKREDWEKAMEKSAKDIGKATMVKDSKKKSPNKQRVIKEGEGQDQNKIFNNKGQHVGNWVNGKKVMLSTKSKHGQLNDAQREFKTDIKLAQAKIKPKTKKK